LGELLDAKKGYEMLRELWKEVGKIDIKDLDKVSFIEDSNLIAKVRLIIRGKTESYKYALLCQLLAKAIDPSINALAIQAKAKVPGSFDARSFCKKTLVPFERDYLRNILGGSGDPYVSKPLRHETISLSVLEEIRDKRGWKDLYEILKTVQEKEDAEFAKNVLRQALLEVRKLLIEVQVKRPISIIKPRSLTLTDLNNAIDKFLAEPSGGIRPQAIVYALMRVINGRIKAFNTIKTAKATVPDAAVKKPSDIECIGKDGNIVGIYVTDVLDDNKFKEDLSKAVRNKLTKIMIIAYKFKPSLNFKDILKHYTWNYNIDVVVINITEFMNIILTLLNNSAREEFIQEVARVLQELGYPDHAMAWINVLEEMKVIKIT
jgi:hypothetical protein